MEGSDMLKSKSYIGMSAGGCGLNVCVCVCTIRSLMNALPRLSRNAIERLFI